MREDTANATEVFEALGLDLLALSQIFVTKPHEFYTVPREKRGVQPMAANYQDLGLCRAQDEDGWIALAKLVNKEIRLILGESDGQLIRIYYPSGEVKRIEWYHRWLNKLIDIFSEKKGVFFKKKAKRAKLTL